MSEAGQQMATQSNKIPTVSKPLRRRIKMQPRRIGVPRLLAQEQHCPRHIVRHHRRDEFVPAGLAVGLDVGEDFGAGGARRDQADADAAADASRAVSPASGNQLSDSTAVWRPRPRASIVA